MPDVADGLTNDPTPDEMDPFEASLRAKLDDDGDSGVPPAEPDAPAEPEPEEPPKGPARDPETGKFMSRGTPEPDEGTPSEGDGEPDATPQPEDDKTWRERYEEAQRIIDRQGNELGELRSKAEKPAEPDAPAEPEQLPTISREQAEQFVEEQGPAGAVAALIQGQVDPSSQLYNAVFDAALEEVEGNAQIAQFVRADFMYRQDFAAAQEEAPEEPDDREQFLEEAYLHSRMSEAVATVREKVSDYEQLEDHFPKALELAPNLLGEMASGDPSKMIPALTQMTLLARGIKAQVDAATAPGAPNTPDASTAKLAAQVASGSLRAAPESEVPAQGEEDPGIAAFRKFWKEADTPTVADGLTTG